MKITRNEFINIMNMYKENLDRTLEIHEVLSEQYIMDYIEPGFFSIFDQMMVDLGIVAELGDDSVFDNWLWDWGSGDIPIAWEKDDEGNLYTTKTTKDLGEAYDALIPEECKCE